MAGKEAGKGTFWMAAEWERLQALDNYIDPQATVCFEHASHGFGESMPHATKLRK